MSKEEVDGLVKGRLSKNQSLMEISCELYLYRFPEAFSGDDGVGFEILREVSSFFNTPFSSVYVAGSAQLGYSYVKGREFISGESDLDVAVINPALFRTYFELVHQDTRNFTNLTRFPRGPGGIDNSERFRAYLLKGVIRPDLLPYCKARTKWFEFFGDLSTKYASAFKKISAGIYFSEYFFKAKQLSVITKISK